MTYPDSVIHNPEYGLTKREYFAAMAMQGLLANNKLVDTILISTPTNRSKIANIAIFSADALIKELNKKKL